MTYKGDTTMKRTLFFLLGIVFVLSARAAEITDVQAAAAVQAWMDEGVSLGRKPGVVASCETISTASGARFHVVNLKEGGFAVTPSDDRIDPIIAFVPSGANLVRSDKNPLWALLSRDIAARERAAGASSGTVSYNRILPSTPSPSETASSEAVFRAQARWAKLLGKSSAADKNRLIHASVTPGAPADIVVDPFVESRWCQDVHNNYGLGNGLPCYNYYTPNNYPCGCIVAASSQIMRYWQWPTAYVAAKQFPCKVDGASVTYSMMGGYYDWRNMPLVPASGVTEENCKAIGKLTYDIGVSIGMNWAPQNSVANLYALVPRLKDIFGYANSVAAVYINGHYSYSLDELKKVVIPNCDARAPVAMAISGDGEHAAVIDGYGYSGDDFYMHINFGWAGLYDAWYLPPNILDFDTIDGFVFNIFPRSTGSILSGRVFDAVHTPIKGAAVTLHLGTKVIATTTTDGNGIYAFIADAGRYSVTATVGDSSHSISVTLDKTTGTRLDEDGLYYNSTASIGNSYGNDIELIGVDGVARPVLSPGTCLFYPSTNVTITCPEPGATIRYTLDGTDPTDSSPFYRYPITVEDNVTIKARAWKADLNPSTVASATYRYDASNTSLLRGDKFNYPFVIYGANNSHKIDDNSGYTIGNEQGEPAHVPGYYQYRTIWYKWKAPGSGQMTFSINHENNDYLLPPSIAVYSGSSLNGLGETKLACHANPGDGAVATVTVDVEHDHEYRIVAMSQYGNYSGFFNLDWSGDLVPNTPFVVVDEDDDSHGFLSIDEAIVAASKTYHSHYKYILVNENLTFVPPADIRFKPNTGVTITAKPLSQEYCEPRPVSSGNEGVVVYETDNKATTYTWTGAKDSDWNEAGNWTYEENGMPTTATRHPNATDTVVFANGATATISGATEVHSVLINLTDKNKGVMFAFNSRGTSTETSTRASLSCSSFAFPSGTLSIAFSSTSYALFDGARLISWSDGAPAGKFALASHHNEFELVVDSNGLVVFAKPEAKNTQTAVVGNYTWTFALDGKNAVLYNNGAAAVTPTPKGHIDIPSKLGNYTVTEVGDWAFADCDEMSSVYVPDSVKLIGRYAFAGCAALQCADVGKGIADAGKGAVTIKKNAFSDCSALSAVAFRGTAAPVISDNNILDGTPDNCTIYAPKSAKNWPQGTWLGKTVVRGDCMVNVRTLAKPGAASGCKSLAGGGSCALGKKATLKATPNGGYVFAGWYDSATEELLSRAASYTYVVTGEAVTFLADFVSLAKDEADLSTTLSGTTLSTAEDGSFAMSVDEHVNTHSEFKAAFKNLPTGLKYDAKTYKINGKATKPGIYKIVMGLTNAAVKKAKNYEFTIIVPNFHDPMVNVSGEYGPYIPGVQYKETFGAAASGWSVSGLPAGMKWTDKETLDSQKQKVEPYSVYGAPTKPGNYTVYFTKTVKELDEKGRMSNVKHTSTATFVVSDFPVLSIQKTGRGSGKVTGAGAYPANKKVSLKATADKGSVFRGWYMAPYSEDDIISQAASLSYIMPDSNETLVANFITVAEDKAGISTKFNNGEFEFNVDGKQVEKSIPCGIYLEWPIEVSALSLPTVKITGLPSGLKFTAKDVVDSKTKEVIVPANTIYGTPTAASKVNKGVVTPSAVKITVTTASKTTVNYTIAMTVDPIPEWAVGTFEGGTATDGLTTLTVSSAGKISGKTLDGNLTWTLTANNFDDYDEAKELYTATIAAKGGTTTLTDRLTISRGDAGGIVAIGETFDAGDLYQYNWKAEPWKTISAKFGGMLSFGSELDKACPGTVTLTFKKGAGTVTTKGVFGQYSASGSATLTPIALPDDNDEFLGYVHVYFPPKADKGFKGYGIRLPVKWNGSNFEFAAE